AAMGVWTLLRRPPNDGTEMRFDPVDPARDRAAIPVAVGVEDARISTVILKTAAALLVPLSLVFGVYVFFKGHQSPGGGFVGGLITGVTLIVYRMTYGAQRLRRLLPVSERTLIAWGLALAAGTGAAALLAGLPFLTSNNGYLPLPDGTSFHWATVIFFDLGVYLVVVGVLVGMLDVLTRELE